MERRTVAGTFCSALFASSVAAVIGATALPQTSPFFVAMLVIGAAGISASIMGFAWLFFTRPQELAASDALPISSEWIETEVAATDDGKALKTLKRARDNAVIASKRRDEDACRLAADELFAAFVTIDRQFDLGCGRIKFLGGSNRALVQPMLAFADQIYPLLREGHIAEAKARTNLFRWPAL